MTLEQLHHDEVLPAVLGRLADVVDRADVRVVERGGRARLTLEPVHGLCIGRELRRQEFQRDAPAEPDILGLVDDTHSAPAEKLEDAVM